MRVDFDTNIFISAFVIPGSLAEKAILKIIEGVDCLLISAAFGKSDPESQLPRCEIRKEVCP